MITPSLFIYPLPDLSFIRYKFSEKGKKSNAAQRGKTKKVIIKRFFHDITLQLTLKDFIMVLRE